MVDIAKDAKALLEDAKKKRAESKGAASASSAGKQKTEEELEKERVEAEAKEKAEAKAKKDGEILSKKDGELNDEEKKRKVALLDIKKKEDEKLLSTPDNELDEKGKKRKAELVKAKPSKMELRIHELVDEIGKLKKEGKKSAEKDKRIEILEEELAAVKKTLSMTPEDLFKQKVKEISSTRISKHIEEDKGKPREERREMTTEELNDWMAEDAVVAQEWIADRAIRRRDDKRRDNIKQGQHQSYQKVLKDNPKMDMDKALERGKALREEGKSDDEISKVLAEEFLECVIAAVVMEESPYLLNYPNGPEIVAKEVKRRMAKPDTKKEDTSKIDDLEKKITELSAELERVKNLDVSIISNRSPVVEEETDMGKKLSQLAAEVKLDPKKVAARVKDRESKGHGR